MRSIYPLLVFVVISVFACRTDKHIPLSIIPYPASLQISRGQFELSSETRLNVNDGGQFANEIDFLQSLMKKTLGHPLAAGKGKNSIEVNISDNHVKPGTYSMKVTRRKITISASDASGLFYALQTFRQLLPPGIESGQTVPSVMLPCLSISDYPAFAWRGMHLDVSRHFFSIGYLERYVDLLALYKFNKLHLHLTDDQGWRIEIKKYPGLTVKGAWRVFNSQDSACMERAKDDPDFAIDPKHIVIKDGKPLYGGFYTQEQMKGLVAYARTRHVDIIPEIDMPGHMMAAINAYPFLSSSDKAGWGTLFSFPLCPCKDEVYTFAENVLQEIIDIFPSKYIHIGADEVEKTTWANSARCKEFMKNEGIENVNQLQTYFVQKIQRFLVSKGKEVIVWDDALEGNVGSDLDIMYWRNWVAGVPEKAIKNGNKIIMAPGDPLYISRMGIPLYDIYHMKVTGKDIPADKTSQVLGVQACLWTETVPSEKRADALIFPRITALAEQAWSPGAVHDWESFKCRLDSQLQRLACLGVNYHYQPTYALIPIMQVDTLHRRIGITFDSEKYKPDIYYTTDGTVPTVRSYHYQGTFFVTGSAAIRAAVFAGGKLQEPVLSKQVDYHKAIGKSVTYHKPWNSAYPAGDAGALTDGYRGGTNYNDGRWQGFTTDIDVTIDLGTVTGLNRFSATFMQITGPGVYMPEYVEVALSPDRVHFEKALMIKNDIPAEETALTFKDFSGSLSGKTARYVKVLARNRDKAFIFTDEIIVD